jgi:hypothetical protein
MIEDVTAKNNALSGMYLTGTGITVNNANIGNNEYGLAIGSNAENNEITLDGDITVTNNKFGFDTTSSAQGTVYVTGDFNLNRNDEVGLEASSADLTIAVGGSYSGKSGKSGSGSLRACDNSLYDIGNAGGSTFLREVIIHVTMTKLLGMAYLIASIAIQVVVSPQRPPITRLRRLSLVSWK